MNETTWTKERDDIVRSMFSERKTASQVGEALGVTRNAVLGRAYRLGLSKGSTADYTPRKKGGRPRKRGPKMGPRLEPTQLRDTLMEQGLHEVMKDAREVGLSWAKIGAHLGINYQTALKYAKLMGIYEPTLQNRMTPEDIQTIVNDWNNFVPLEDIADKIGRTFGTLRQKVLHLQRAGLLSGRQGAGVRIVKRYGREALIAGRDPKEILAELNAAKQEALSAALREAMNAKTKRRDLAIEAMHKAIADGEERNVAIFKCRAEGVQLELIAAAFDTPITRERVRQICNKVASDMALKALLEPKKEEKAE